MEDYWKRVESQIQHLKMYEFEEKSFVDIDTLTTAGSIVEEKR